MLQLEAGKTYKDGQNELHTIIRVIKGECPYWSDKGSSFNDKGQWLNGSYHLKNLIEEIKPEAMQEIETTIPDVIKNVEVTVPIEEVKECIIKAIITDIKVDEMDIGNIGPRGDEKQPATSGYIQHDTSNDEEIDQLYVDLKNIVKVLNAMPKEHQFASIAFINKRFKIGGDCCGF